MLNNGDTVDHQKKQRDPDIVEDDWEKRGTLPTEGLLSVPSDSLFYSLVPAFQRSISLFGMMAGGPITRHDITGPMIKRMGASQSIGRWRFLSDLFVF